MISGESAGGTPRGDAQVRAFVIVPYLRLCSVYSKPRQGSRRMPTLFHLFLIKPSHYDNDGYVIQWVRSAIPANTLAAMNGLALDCAQRRVLGEDVEIRITIWDETNTRIRPDRIIRQIRKSGGRGLVALVGVQTNQYPRAMDLARPLRAAGIPVCIGGFHVSGTIAMLPEVPPELVEAMDLGISLFAGEAERRLEDLLRAAWETKLEPLYNFMNDLPGMEGEPTPYLPADVVRRTAGVRTSFDAGRGCPFLCSFCTIINVQGRKSRSRTADDVERLVRANIAQGINTALGSAYELRLVDGNIESAFDDRVAAALITQVDYRSGRMHDMQRLNEAAVSAGLRIIWDLSHSAGAVPVNLATSGTELAVGCGYKYLNGGPGAPAYLYVAKSLQRDFPMSLAGWFGHVAPFDFNPEYSPAVGIERFQCGTPSVLAMLALECGLATFSDISFANLRRKSLSLSDLFWQLIDVHCAEFGFACISPRDHAMRGSQLSFAHEQAYSIMQAIIERGVIGDFRKPDLIRFGFAPLYLRYTDIWDAVVALRDVMQSDAWKAYRHQHRNQVT